jgi:hypothetical protein
MKLQLVSVKINIVRINDVNTFWIGKILAYGGKETVFFTAKHMALYFLSGLTLNVWNAISVQFQTKNKEIQKIQLLCTKA